MTPLSPASTDLVLVGGGHAHVHVLTAFAKLPEPGVRLTLVTRDFKTPYSGMLPGVVAGLYSVDEAHIDLVRLCAATGARLIHAEANGIDRLNKRVEFAGQPPIAYDLLSINVGIAPALSAIEGAAERAIAVKPIGLFLSKFNALLGECRRLERPRRIAVIGGGAGGAELLLSVRSRLLKEMAGADFSFVLATDGEVLAQHDARVRDAFRRAFAARGIALHEHRKARAVTAEGIMLAEGTTIAVPGHGPRARAYELKFA